LLAVCKGYEEIVTLLLDRGADINAKDKDGVTALWLAVCKGYEEIVTLLLDRGADIKAKDRDGNTPLHLAAIPQWWDFPVRKSLMRELLCKGASLNIQNNDNFTPFQLINLNNFKEFLFELYQEKNFLMDSLHIPSIFFYTQEQIEHTSNGIEPYIKLFNMLLDYKIESLQSLKNNFEFIFEKSLTPAQEIYQSLTKIAVVRFLPEELEENSQSILDSALEAPQKTLVLSTQFMNQIEVEIRLANKKREEESLEETKTSEEKLRTFIEEKRVEALEKAQSLNNHLITLIQTVNQALKVPSTGHQLKVIEEAKEAIRAAKLLKESERLHLTGLPKEIIVSSLDFLAPPLLTPCEATWLEDRIREQTDALSRLNEQERTTETTRVIIDRIKKEVQYLSLMHSRIKEYEEQLFIVKERFLPASLDSQSEYIESLASDRAGADLPLKALRYQG
jgi:hypothetical protein